MTNKSIKNGVNVLQSAGHIPDWAFSIVEYLLLSAVEPLERSFIMQLHDEYEILKQDWN